MPNKRVDHTTVVMMAKTGFHPEAIAERLGCSRRQVDRIIKANSVSIEPLFFDFEDEHLYWRFYRNGWKESYAKIARRFGVSRQAVQQYFDTYEQRKNAPMVVHEPGNVVPFALAEEAEFSIIN